MSASLCDEQSSAAVRQSKTFDMGWRKYQLADLQKLAALFAQALAESKAQGSIRNSVEFTVRCSDGSGFDSVSPAFLAQDSILASKRLATVTMEFNDYEAGRRAYLHLSHGNYGTNELTVKSSDKGWVNGFVASIGDIVDGVSPQNTFAGKHSTIAALAAALPIELLMLSTLDLTSRIWGEKIDWAKLVSGSGIGAGLSLFAMSYVFAGLALMKIGEVFPKVELISLSMHLNTENRRRMRLLIVFTLIILPALVNLVTGVWLGLVMR